MVGGGGSNMKGETAGRSWGLYLCFSRESWIKVLLNIPMEMFWAACSVPRVFITKWPCSEENTWKVCGRELAFHQARWSPQKSHSTPSESGWPRALPWHADFSLASRLCWVWDAKRFGQTPAPSQTCSLPALGRNMKCVLQLFLVPLASSPCCKLDAGPATHTRPPRLIRMSLISRHPKPWKENALTLSDARSQEYSSGPAAHMFLASNLNNPVPNTNLPQCHTWIYCLSKLGKLSCLIKNILRMRI